MDILSKTKSGTKLRCFRIPIILDEYFEKRSNRNKKNTSHSVTKEILDVLWEHYEKEGK